MAPVYKLSASSVTGRTTYGSMLAGNPAYEFPNSFESIATYEVGAGGASSVTFSSIPNTYKHLQIRGINRFAGFDTGYGIYFNNNTTTTNYYSHAINGNGASAFTQTMQDGFLIWNQPNNNASSGIFGAFVADILDYSSTSKNKTVRTLFGFDRNGAGTLGLASVLWVNTSAITTIKLDARAQGSTSDFAQYSHFALYGVKGVA